MKQSLGLTQKWGTHRHPLSRALQIGFELQHAVCSPFPLLSSAFPPRPLSSSHVAVCSGNYGDVLWELLSWRDDDDDDEFPHGHAVKRVSDRATSQQLP